MQLACNSLTSEHPCDEISYSAKNLRGGSKAKRQDAINVGFPFPAYTEEVVVSWVNWNYMIGVPDIQFYQFRISAALLNGGHCVVDGSIARERSLGSIPLLTLLPEGQDRSTIRRHLLVWCAFETKPIGLT